MNIASIKPTITRREIEGVLNCLLNGELTKDNSIKEFESIISNLVGLQYCIATNSLSSAYHMAFKALEIKSGDEVIIPSYFDIAPLGALNLVGGTVVLVDVDENSFTPSINQIKEKITEKTRAVVISHMFGFFAPIEELLALNVPIIEDISHIIGAENEEIPVGSAGTITVSSLAPGCIITTGNGGIALTNNSRYYSIMKDSREDSNKNQSISYDCGLTNFQGAMGISQLTRLYDFINRRKEIAKLYYEALKFSPHKTIYHYNDSFAFQSFPIIFDAPAEKVEKYWKKSGIDIYRPIEKPLHKYLDLKLMDYPRSDRYANKLYTLPIYPALTKREIDKISNALAKFI
ncbi:MAG: DegT/DnrJ/EryC1/StrS family aminotransferase [Spirochaetes bacterium]|nr:DegT/DnrJ/EryC1/StrS family aminotransferase [Spirochaetota bacterium]